MIVYFEGCYLLPCQKLWEILLGGFHYSKIDMKFSIMCATSSLRQRWRLRFRDFWNNGKKMMSNCTLIWKHTGSISEDWEIPFNDVIKDFSFVSEENCWSVPDLNETKKNSLLDCYLQSPQVALDELIGKISPSSPGAPRWNARDAAAKPVLEISTISPIPSAWHVLNAQGMFPVTTQCIGDRSINVQSCPLKK